MQRIPNTVGCSNARKAMHVVVLTSAIVSWSTPVRAQRLEPVGLVNAHAVADFQVAQVQFQDMPPRFDDLPERLILGLVGTIGGVYAGASVGAQQARGCHGEFCALNSELIGSAFGGAIVSSIAAGMPSGSSSCGRVKRIASALLGSGTGVVVGGVSGLVAGPLGVVLGAMSGSTIGSAMGATLCE